MKQLLSWVLLCFTTIAFAQEDLTVSVIDFETQKPISSLTIKLLNSTRNIALQQTTNMQGKAIFRNIPALDGYQVLFEETTDYVAESSDILSIRSNQNPNVILVLQKNSTQTLQEIVISANSTSKINRRDAEVSFEMKAAEIQEIPVEGRDITRVPYIVCQM